MLGRKIKHGESQEISVWEAGVEVLATAARDDLIVTGTQRGDQKEEWGDPRDYQEKNSRQSYKCPEVRA